jgi:hypothetical protein
MASVVKAGHRGCGRNGEMFSPLRRKVGKYSKVPISRARSFSESPWEPPVLSAGHAAKNAFDLQHV